MKAIRMARTGAPDVLEYVDVPTPVPGPHEALVEADTIGVNMPEVHVRRGRYSTMPPLPVIPGIEMSGRVAAVGEAVREVRVGDPVYVSARELPHRCGCYAEYIAVDAGALLPLPPDVDLEAAATLSSYQVAWHLLHSATRGFEYESVLVTAPAGGIGTACLQLAADAGRVVLALTSSTDKARHAKAQGARAAVVHGDARWGETLLEATGSRGADLILDAVAGARLPSLFDCAAPLGLVVQYGYLTGWPESAAVFDAMRARFSRSPALRLFSMHTLDALPHARRAANQALLDLLRRGGIRPVIQERIPLAAAARAHELLENGAMLGKLVLEP